MVDEEGYEQYCDKLEHTSEWGGQIEVRFLVSSCLDLHICRVGNIEYNLVLVTDTCSILWSGHGND